MPWQSEVCSGSSGGKGENMSATHELPIFLLILLEIAFLLLWPSESKDTQFSQQAGEGQ